MSDQSKDLPDEEHDAGESLDFTAQALLEEISKYFSVQPRQPGDLDINQVAKFFGITVETARKRTREMIVKGILTKAKVCGPNGNAIVVFRRASA